MKVKNQHLVLIISLLCCHISFVLPVEGQGILTVDDAVRIALKNNFEIQLAKNDASVSKANNTAGNAGMLPSVGLVGSGNYSLNNTTQKLNVGTENNYPQLSNVGLSAGLQLNWTVFDGGRMFVTKSKLNEIEKLGEIQYREKVMQSLSSVYSAYYDVVRQKQQLNSLIEASNLTKNRVSIAQTGFNSGSLLKTDLLQAKIDLNVITENTINQQFVIQSAKKNLNVLLGRNGDEAFEISDSISLNYRPEKSELTKKVMSSNPGIQTYQKLNDISSLILKETQGLYLPTVGLKGGYYVAQTTNSDGSVLSNSSAGPQIGASISIPLYAGGETKRKETVAKLQKQSTELELQNIKLQVATQLQNVLTDFENQEQLLQIEKENNALALENLQISMERLKLGQSTSIEVHLAQENFVQSSTRMINFRYRLKMAEIMLKQLVSEL